jgi:hypothetical protein
MKGVNSKNISLDDLKKSFYNSETNNNSTFNLHDQLLINKKNMILKQSYITKKIYIDAYDKRLFSKDKKSTYPISHSYNRSE